VRKQLVQFLHKFKKREIEESNTVDEFDKAIKKLNQVKKKK
jgi:hypothetical protein